MKGPYLLGIFWILMSLSFLSAQVAGGSGGASSVEGEAGEDEIDWANWIRPWSEEDLKKLASGELVPGEDFFGPVAMQDSGEPFIMPEIEETLELVLDDLPMAGPELVKPRVLELFFDRRPARYLSDPQGLLSEQVYSDSAGFLDYHAGDSEIDLYVYLFAKDQVLPPDLRPKLIHGRHFAKSGSAAVVFYWLGAPQRSQWAVGPKVQELIPENELRVALTEAVDASFRKSDPADQLDGFCVQLSNRLHWIANTIQVQTQAEQMGSPSEEEQAAEAHMRVEVIPEEGSQDAVVDADQMNKYLLWAAGVLSGLLFLGWMGWKIIRTITQKCYKLKPIVGESALGATQGAGVGAVISFSSTRVPPALQREQVPDYTDEGE